MGRYRFNPFTGTLDDVGSGSGGGGTVTSVAGGVGVTNTPEPIVGAGTVDLDLFTLPVQPGPEAGLQLGDWLAIVDVSVGTSVAAQRKIQASEIADFITFELGSSSGILVGNGLGGIEYRSIQVADTATVDLTITNGDGVAGDPTLQAAVIPGGIPHSALAGLTAGDAGHTQFLLLAGRAGTTNDPTLSTTTDGTLSGSSAVGNDLILKAVASAAQADQGFIETFGRVKLMTGHNSYGLGATNRALDWDVGGTYDNAGANVCAFNIDGTITFNANPTLSDAVFFRVAPIQHFTNPAHTQGLLTGILSNQTQILADGAGVNIGATNIGGFSMQTQRNTANGGTIGGGTDTLCSSQPILSGSVTGITYRGMQLLTPGGTTGAAGVGVFLGLEFEDFTPTGTPNLSYLSRGSGANGHGFLHGGWGRFGAIPASLAQSAGGPMLQVDGTLRLAADVNTGAAPQLQLREAVASGSNQQTFESPALAADLNYVLPNAFPTTNGQSLTSTTAGAMSWAAMQPLDADLTAIAAIGVSEGSLIIGDNTPAWVELVIGATDKYLRSNGTTAAWADVTELGLVDTVNGIATVSNGVSATVAEVNATAQGGNIGTTTMFTPAADGFYVMYVEIIVTRVATVSSTRPQVDLAWTNGDNSAAQTATVASSAGNTLQTRGQITQIIYVDASTNITYATSGYASVGATSMQYALRIRLERL